MALGASAEPAVSGAISGGNWQRERPQARQQAESSMRKILVMIPAGEVYDHDTVSVGTRPTIPSVIDQYHNIGDAFVHDSSLKLLDYIKFRYSRSAGQPGGHRPVQRRIRLLLFARIELPESLDGLVERSQCAEKAEDPGNRFRHRRTSALLRAAHPLGRDEASDAGHRGSLDDARRARNLRGPNFSGPSASKTSG